MWPDLVFWCSCGVLLFTYVGYPVVLCLLAPWRKSPVIRPGVWEPSVSLIIAARNEAVHIEAKLRNCAALDYPTDKIEIVVVDDGSEDDTAERIGRLALPGLRLISHKRRLGKSVALNRAVSEASGDVLVFTDADSLIDSESLRWLVRPFVNPIVGCVAGRYRAGGLTGQNACAVGFYWRYESFLRHKESQVGGLLGASGALFALRSEIFEPLAPGLINDDFVIPMLASMKGYRTLYEPRARAVEDDSRNAEIEFARRVRIMAGNCQHLWLFRRLLLRAPFSRPGFQLFCHKFLRVLSPFWLALAFASCAALRHHVVYLVTFWPQVLFYMAAAAGYALKPRHRLGFLVNLPYYFVMLNLAAVLGVYYFLFNHAVVPWGRSAGAAAGHVVGRVPPAEVPNPIGIADSKN